MCPPGAFSLFLLWHSSFHFLPAACLVFFLALLMALSLALLLSLSQVFSIVPAFLSLPKQFLLQESRLAPCMLPFCGHQPSLPISSSCCLRPNLGFLCLTSTVSSCHSAFAGIFGDSFPLTVPVLTLPGDRLCPLLYLFGFQATKICLRKL